MLFVYMQSFFAWQSIITKTRCDGVIEYTYEYFGYKVGGGNTYWNISINNSTNFNAHSGINITPKTVFDGKERLWESLLCCYCFNLNLYCSSFSDCHSILILMPGIRFLCSSVSTGSAGLSSLWRRFICFFKALK